MNSLKQRLMYNWHLMRLFRLIIGAWLVIVAIYMREWMTGLFGAFFLYQAITDTGCGVNGCYTSKAGRYNKSSKATIDDIEYEELKN